MSNEIQVDDVTGKTVYAQVRNSSGQVWNTNTAAFESYVTANIANYAITLTEQGTASAYYAGNFPTGITTPGIYSIAAKERAGGSPAETDLGVADGDIFWTGAAVGLPTGLSKGVARPNFQFFMASSTDHVTGLTGLTVTAQRSIDGGAFGACTNNPTEVGAGLYVINLSASDLNGGVIELKFTATGADATTMTVVPTP